MTESFKVICELSELLLLAIPVCLYLPGSGRFTMMLNLGQLACTDSRASWHAHTSLKGTSANNTDIDSDDLRASTIKLVRTSTWLYPQNREIWRSHFATLTHRPSLAIAPPTRHLHQRPPKLVVTSTPRRRDYRRSGPRPEPCPPGEQLRQRCANRSRPRLATKTFR